MSPFSTKHALSILLGSTLLYILINVNLIFASLVNAQTTETVILEQKIERFIYSEDNLRNSSESVITDENGGAIRPPFIFPNPVGHAGQVNFVANQTDWGSRIESINVSIKGPSVGSTNPLLSPATIGSLSMRQMSNISHGGLWTGNFSFPPDLPDGNYVYTLTIKDTTGRHITTHLFSGITLDRNQPDAAETKIASAIDSEGKSVSNGGITTSPNITFTFEGIDRTGIVQSFECNLDDIVVVGGGEHGHGDDPSQGLTAYSTCFTPPKIAAQAVGSHTYSFLSPGNHTFKVRAIDNEYDVDSSPSTFSWSILPPSIPSITTPGADH